jgi:hypothetical protein
MPIDDQRLIRLRRYEDAQAGIYEEFAERRLGPWNALALLAAPLGERRATGWLICPSIGPEHGNMRRLEAILARRLAAAGFPVLRIRPDVDSTQGLMREIDLSARLREIEEGVELLRSEAETRDVALTGALFGATVAALSCERHGLGAMALIEPAPRGRQYAREAIMREAVADLMTAPDAEAPASQRPMRELAETGRTTVRGLGLSSAELDRISAVNLLEDLRSYSGRSLLVGVSPTGAIGPGLRKLQTRLEELGGDVTVEAVQDPLEAPLGDYYYRNVGAVRVDTRLALDQSLATLVAGWALAAPAAPAAGP